MIKRIYSSAANIVPRICVVGSGPAGFYAAMHLSKHLTNINIDIFEKLPVPYGLVRFGVAPDHPEVKNVINQFTKVANKPNVNFYGNITLGKDISLLQLRKHYDAVLLTYGAEEDKTLGIDNEDAQNIVAARNFVGWYNGHPRDKDLKVDLSVSTAAILGQGNVALDVARILLTPVDVLRKTDITEHALSALAESKVNELYLIGRRGPLQVAFTIKELREQIKLPNCKTIWREQDFVGVEEAVATLSRPRKRLTELMLKSLNESRNCVENNDRYFKPIFFRSPSKFLTNNSNNVSGIELICNKLIGDNLENKKCVATDQREVLDCDLVFRSIGYKSVKADKDIVFDSNGFVVNDKGRVIESNAPQDLGRLYVSGWLGTGPVGVILHTMSNAFLVAKAICEDFKDFNNSPKGGFEEVKNILKNHQIVDWKAWEKIDKYEIEQGKKLAFTGYFRDGTKRIDLVLVINDDGDSKVEMLRVNFLSNVVKTGLEIELEQGVRAKNKNLIFVKIHAPPHVIIQYGEFFNIRRFFKDNHADFINPRSWYFDMLPIGTDKRRERELVKFVRKQNKGPLNYSTLERSTIVYKILLMLPFGLYENYVGLNRLLKHRIILDAFPLHDGPYFFVPSQDPTRINGRQALNFNSIKAASTSGGCAAARKLLIRYFWT
ncbi:NADPH:adrenodoxin oxidoreductase, mitochondrial [Papilio machaon]|uniref:Ferredoxin--NADP(+) reductase n=1 Tax=Papilio machaon TaxID=76193 RepID=A0A0N1PHC9_PAPMA|nr:NADPH:adrenodoxin oxidoreductase, mitochondrial [Papilio machaon]